MFPVEAVASRLTCQMFVERGGKVLVHDAPDLGNTICRFLEVSHHLSSDVRVEATVVVPDGLDKRRESKLPGLQYNEANGLIGRLALLDVPKDLNLLRARHKWNKLPPAIFQDSNAEACSEEKLSVCLTSIEKLNRLIIHLAMVAKIDTVVDSAGMMPTWNSLY
jgi:hypothetical protein